MRIKFKRGILLARVNYYKILLMIIALLGFGMLNACKSRKPITKYGPRPVTKYGVQIAPYQAIVQPGTDKVSD